MLLGLTHHLSACLEKINLKHTMPLKSRSSAKSTKITVRIRNEVRVYEHTIHFITSQIKEIMLMFLI
jgi:hypothetical protein